MKHLLEYFKFNELSDEAAKNAIEKVRDEKYAGHYGEYNIAEDAIDDDALFEPSYEEMAELFGGDYYEENNNSHMIENTRKNISFEGTQSQNYYLQCEDALNVTNDNLFFRWLGIPTRFWTYISYSFKDSTWSSKNTNIEFDIDEQWLEENLGEGSLAKLEPYLEKAEKKFDQHISNVLSTISSNIDKQFEDEGIVDTIEALDLTFTEEGEIEDSEE
jgi:hypothetical protein